MSKHQKVAIKETTEGFLCELVCGNFSKSQELFRVNYFKSASLSLNFEAAFRQNKLAYQKKIGNLTFSQKSKNQKNSKIVNIFDKERAVSSFLVFDDNVA